MATVTITKTKTRTKTTTGAGETISLVGGGKATQIYNIAFQREADKEIYLFVKVLGKGNEGEAQLVVKRSTGELYVRKVLRPRVENQPYGSTHEVSAVRLLQGYQTNGFDPRIVHLEFDQDVQVTTSTTWWARESYWSFHNAGNAAHWFYGEDKNFVSPPVSLTARYLRHLYSSILFMRHGGHRVVYHRDLHLNNVLLHFEEGARLPDAYVGDFGHAGWLGRSAPQSEHVTWEHGLDSDFRRAKEQWDLLMRIGQPDPTLPTVQRLLDLYPQARQFIEASKKRRIQEREFRDLIADLQRVENECLNDEAGTRPFRTFCARLRNAATQANSSTQPYEIHATDPADARNQAKAEGICGPWRLFQGQDFVDNTRGGFAALDLTDEEKKRAGRPKPNGQAVMRYRNAREAWDANGGEPFSDDEYIDDDGDGDGGDGGGDDIYNDSDEETQIAREQRYQEFLKKYQERPEDYPRREFEDDDYDAETELFQRRAKYDAKRELVEAGKARWSDEDSDDREGAHNKEKERRERKLRGKEARRAERNKGPKVKIEPPSDEDAANSPTNKKPKAQDTREDQDEEENVEEQRYEQFKGFYQADPGNFIHRSPDEDAYDSEFERFLTRIESEKKAPKQAALDKKSRTKGKRPADVDVAPLPINKKIKTENQDGEENKGRKGGQTASVPPTTGNPFLPKRQPFNPEYGAPTAADKAREDAKRREAKRVRRQAQDQDEQNMKRAEHDRISKELNALRENGKKQRQPGKNRTPSKPTDPSPRSKRHSGPGAQDGKAQDDQPQVDKSQRPRSKDKRMRQPKTPSPPSSPLSSPPASDPATAPPFTSNTAHDSAPASTPATTPAKSNTRTQGTQNKGSQRAGKRKRAGNTALNPTTVSSDDDDEDQADRPQEPPHPSKKPRPSKTTSTPNQVPILRRRQRAAPAPVQPPAPAPGRRSRRSYQYDCGPVPFATRGNGRHGSNCVTLKRFGQCDGCNDLNN